MAEFIAIPSKWNSLIKSFKKSAYQHFYPWYQKNKREMPWRLTKDPYAIWVSEIMLQQTRVDQVIPYFQKFLHQFPDIPSLAHAPQHQVLKVWEGLGYYQRAIKMHQTALIIVDEHHGIFPKDYKSIAKFPGIGAYTSAAIASIAFDLAHPVLDGNVMRVLSRYFHVTSPIHKQPILQQLKWLADSIMDRDQPGIHNQAMMELGALICTPKQPDCASCPLTHHCYSKEHLKPAEIEALPHKVPKKEKPHYPIAVGLIWNQGQIFIHLRPKTGLLPGLWEFPGGKQDEGESLEACCEREIKEETGLHVTVECPFIRVKHAYSHFKITMTVFHCTYVKGDPKSAYQTEWRWVYPEQLREYPFPKANVKIINALLGMDEEQDLLFR